MPPKGRLLSTDPLSVNEILSWLTVRCQSPPSKAIKIAAQLIEKKANSEKGIYDVNDAQWADWVDSRDLCARIKRQARSGILRGQGTVSKPSSGAVLGNTSSSPLASPAKSNQAAKKRKREDNLVLDDDYADFKDHLSEEVLKGRTVVVNRAPVMLAWSTIIAQQLGFSLEEALSIGGCYTSSNAKSKGRSLGLEKRDKPYEENLAKHGPSQPYITFMNRHIPILTLQNDEYRAVEEGGKVVEPKTSYDYLKRSFRQSLKGVLSAMRLTASSFDVQELQDNGSLAFGLYAEFRPTGQGWGERSEVKLDTILALRDKRKATNSNTKDIAPPPVVKTENDQSASRDLSPDFDDLDDAVFDELKAVAG